MQSVSGHLGGRLCCTRKELLCTSLSDINERSFDMKAGVIG